MKFGSNVYKFTQYGEDLAGTKGRFHDIQDSCLAPLPVQRPTPSGSALAVASPRSHRTKFCGAPAAL